MEAWKKLIGGGFAGMDAPFALHPNDQERAMNMIAVMQAANVSWSEAEAAIREYLLAQGVHGPRLEKQMRLVNELVRPRLRG